MDGISAAWLYPLILIAGALAGVGTADERRPAQRAEQSVARQPGLLPAR